METSQFHLADAAALLVQDPIALLYVAAVLARRLDSANQALIELRGQVEAGQPRSVISKTIEKMEGLLGASGALSSMPGIHTIRMHKVHERLKHPRRLEGTKFAP